MKFAVNNTLVYFNLYMLKPAICLGLTIFINGCSTAYMDRSKQAIDARDWDEAYGQMEYALGSESTNRKAEVINLIEKYPELRKAAAMSFSVQNTKKIFSSFGAVHAHKIQNERIAWYSVFAEKKEIDEARHNLEVVYSNEMPKYRAMESARSNDDRTLIVGEELFARLLSEDQDRITKATESISIIPSNSFGKIISVQIIDKSKPGTTSGSQFGSAIGQAAYIDKSITSGNYSALQQVGVGVAGALLGSALDSPPASYYGINYSVQLYDGSVKTISVGSSDGVSLPVGQCVFTADAKDAPSYLCGDTLKAFLTRYMRISLSIKETSDLNAVKRIKCSIPNAGTFSISVEDCDQSKGTVVE